VPAWLDSDVEGDNWDAITAEVALRGSKELVHRGELLGIPVASVGEAEPTEDHADRLGGNTRFVGVPKVVDLSSMWAGPLCGWYLARSGAEVTKIESSTRPDGTRKGSIDFYRRLNIGKNIVALNFENPENISQLRSLIRASDIIIEGSRPRALMHLGIDANEEVERGAIWISITGHGRAEAPNRVGFGDDTAASASLLAKVDDSLWFIGDAIADPITGVTAATLALGNWLAHSGVLLDVGLSPTAALHSQGALSLGSVF
jgi:hypothetical protein